MYILYIKNIPYLTYNMLSSIVQYSMLCIYGMVLFTQWPFQDPRLEVPTIYKAYVRPM